MKIFDDPSQANRINEDLWFIVHQKLLVGMANTDYGKDLLCISKDINLPIIGIKKNEVRYLAKIEGNIATCISDFRVGAKWANVIRYRWEQFNSYARYFQANAGLDARFISPLTLSKRAVFASTLTAYPDPNVETSTFDGYQYKSDGSSFATAHDSATASVNNDSSTTLFLYYQKPTGDNYIVGRIEVLFDTSSIDDAATISAATLSFYGTNVTDQDSDSMSIVSSSPASNTAITNTDFANYGTTKFATDISFSAFATSAYNDFALNSNGISNISLIGISKFGSRVAKDIANTTMGTTNPGNSLEMSSADTTGTSQDPKLVVTYTVSTARSHFTLLGVA